jgi:hypothetical protein
MEDWSRAAPPHGFILFAAPLKNNRDNSLLEGRNHAVRERDHMAGVGFHSFPAQHEQLLIEIDLVPCGL